MPEDQKDHERSPGSGPSRLDKARFVADSGSSTNELKPRLRYEQYIESMNPKNSIFSGRNRKRRRTQMIMLAVGLVVIVALLVYLLLIRQ